MASAEERKQALLASLARSRARLLNAAATLRPGKRGQIFLGTWSARDLLAHLIGWDHTNAQAAREIMTDRLPSFYAHHDRDWASYNARLVAENVREDFDELMRAAESSHHLLIRSLESLSAKEFWRDHGLRFRGWKVTIGRLLQAEAKDEEVHADQLEAWARA